MNSMSSESIELNNILAEMRENSDLTWIINRAGYLLNLTSTEKIELIQMLYRNFIRSTHSLEEILCNKHQTLLHPMILEGLKKAVVERLNLIEAQCQDDCIIAINNPKMFLHGAIFVHRLVIAKDKISGFIVQTIALDVTDEMPFSNFVEIVSNQLQIPIPLLRLFTEKFDAFEDIEEYIPGKNLPVAMRPVSTDYDSWRKRLQVLDPNNLMKIKRDSGTHEFNNEGDQILKLLYIGPSTEIFALPLFYQDFDGVKLSRSITSSLKLKDIRVLAKIPIPARICDEIHTVQLAGLAEPNFQKHKSLHRRRRKAEDYEVVLAPKNISPFDFDSIEPISNIYIPQNVRKCDRKLNDRNSIHSVQA